MPTSQARYSRAEFAKRGQEIYERSVQTTVQPDDEGKFVAIDIDSGSFALDRNDLAATELLLNRCPNPQIWLTRVGRPTAYTSGVHKGSRISS